jgi:hypothetical protein
MWRTEGGENREYFAQKTAALMRDPEKFKAAMMRAVNEWPHSCEMNLSAMSLNRQAWMGHAGCCIALTSPEELTRLGWHRLTQEEQNIANQMADEVIAFWEQRQAEKQQQDEPEALLFGGEQ